MNKGDIVYGVIPRFSRADHYFIIIRNRIDTFSLLPITSKSGVWDICFDGNCIEIEKLEIKEGEVTLKLLPSFIFLGVFRVNKQCCTSTNFKASAELLEKLRLLDIKTIL